jgi:hypothetical protein
VFPTAACLWYRVCPSPQSGGTGGLPEISWLTAELARAGRVWPVAMSRRSPQHRRRSRAQQSVNCQLRQTLACGSGTSNGGPHSPNLAMSPWYAQPERRLRQECPRHSALSRDGIFFRPCDPQPRVALRHETLRCQSVPPARSSPSLLEVFSEARASPDSCGRLTCRRYLHDAHTGMASGVWSVVGACPRRGTTPPRTLNRARPERAKQGMIAE